MQKVKLFRRDGENRKFKKANSKGVPGRQPSRQAKNYNQRRPHDFQIGDVILIKNVVFSKKISIIVGGSVL